MEKILFGDNQFFGVNHMSEEKARAQAIRFQDINEVIKVLDIAISEGINVFMCTTHDSISKICDHVRSHPDNYKNFSFYPCMPYAHKYANAVTELGYLGTMKMAIPEGKLLNTLVKGGMSLARKDIDAAIGLLIDAEMKMFKGLSTPVIFLQNVVTDLMLGLGAKQALKSYYDHIVENYDAEPGFITMNLPLLLETLDEIGIKNPIICSNINKIGFRMSGGVQDYEKLIATKEFRPVAMSIFASGAIPPAEAIEYVGTQPKIESIVFGASSRQNIKQTVSLIKKYNQSER